MSLSSALNIATSSLGVAQDGITVASNNLANIATPGYIKQENMQQSVIVNGTGEGAEIVGIRANVDKELLRSIQAQTSSLGNSTATDSYYNNIQNLYGQPNADNSLSQAIDAFFNAYQNLSTNPETPSLRTATLNASTDLANKISSTAAGLENLRYAADKEINSDVSTINSYLDNLFDYNKEIIKFPENSSGYINVKQRIDETLGKLSEYLNISTVFDTFGKVSVSTGNGISLLDDATNARLQYSPASSVEVFNNNNSLNALKVTNLNNDGTFSDTSVDLATSGTSSQVTTSLTDGSIKSLLEMRDSIIPGLVDQLDTLATALSNEINSSQNNGYGFPPPSSLTGTTSTTSDTVVGFTGKVMLAVIKDDGTPAPSPFNDEDYYRPLTLDLGNLNGGDGPGIMTVQDIIDQINAYYGPVQNRAAVGNLRNVQLEATSDSVSNSGSATFDLKLDNTSTEDSTVTIQSVKVIDPGTLTEYNVATLPAPNSYTIKAGDMGSTLQSFSLDLTGVPNIANYIVRVSTQVTTASGSQSAADIDFTVANNVTDNRNTQYNATTLTATQGTATFYNAPGSSSFASASLVGADGNPVSAGSPGYLKITTSYGANYSIVINELDSKEVGAPGADSSDITNRGFSHFFGLNNLFVDSGKTGSAALNMQVRSDIQKNANLISTGQLTLSNQPTDTSQALYTYEAGSGNNKAALATSALNQKSVFFKASGTLPSVSITFSGYSGDVIGSVASEALNATNRNDSKKLGMDGLQTLFQKAAGVNSDEELAKIIELQNHFSASAQVINIVQKLFDILSQAMR